MPLPAPREGEPLGFHTYDRYNTLGTLGDPETITWSSIRHACSRYVAEELAKDHGVESRAQRRAIARNVKLYVQQASEFNEAARSAKPNTAPLIFYYSFLNLAKALCELKIPNFHARNECYRHGLSWRPDSQMTVNIFRESISLTTRGVWHALWEALMRKACPAVNPTRLRVIDLFAYCPEVSSEYDSALGKELRTMDLEKPNVMWRGRPAQAWLKFSIHRGEFRFFRVFAPQLLAYIAVPRSGYTEVKSEDKAYRTFESTRSAKLKPRQVAHDALEEDFSALNLITHLGPDRTLHYSIPLQQTLPFRLPQAIISYTILFWLGSLVRYDPHSVAALMDSPAWLLIDGFMSQSRIWLLEQFHWAIWQTESTLWAAR